MFEEVKAKIRSTARQGREAEKIHRVEEAGHTGRVDEHPQLVSQLQDRTLDRSERGGWQGCVRVLRTTLAAELALWLVGLFFVSWVRLPGYGSLLIFLIALTIAAYSVERLFATRLELTTARVPQWFAHQVGVSSPCSATFWLGCSFCSSF